MRGLTLVRRIAARPSIVFEAMRPRHMVMSWSWAFGGELEEGGRISRVEIELTPIGDGTELTFRHAGLWSEASEKSHAQGWTGAFDKLVRHLEKNAAATTDLTSETPEP